MGEHAKIVRWSDEDNCYVGTCPSLFYGGVHGKNEMKVFRDLGRVIAEWERWENRRRKPAYRTKRSRAYSTRRRAY